MNVHIVYITIGSMEEAKQIGEAIVQSKLAACVNIIDNMHSIYFWEGKLQNDQEVVMIAKTTENQVSALIERVKTLHSYDCPCILSLPVSKGHTPFMEWIAGEVKG